MLHIEDIKIGDILYSYCNGTYRKYEVVQKNQYESGIRWIVCKYIHDNKIQYCDIYYDEINPSYEWKHLSKQ